MKTIVIFLNLILCGGVIYSQSITIGEGAEINVGASGDICASSWGNITGNLTGPGTQCDGALPVTILNFSASIENYRDIKIKWVTAIEINNKGFEIQRKKLNSDWILTGWVNGAGNTTLPVEYNFTDFKLDLGVYTYRLKQVDYNGNSEYFPLLNELTVGKPGEFGISQNYPNPSNPSSKIDYQIPFSGKVLIKVFDITGREVTELVNETKEAGYYSVKFDGSNLSSGVYFYKISAEGNNMKYSSTKKMLLLK